MKDKKTLNQRITEAKRTNQLNLSYQNLSSLPEEIFELTNLITLDIWGNQLEELSSEIKQLTNLTNLDISNNKLTKLPPEIKQLTNLTTLHIWENQLAKLPPEIKQLTNLTFLNISNNKLRKLPLEITQLTNLTHLYISYNQLEELSSEIKQLTNLTNLDVSHNKLTKLPPEIKQLTNLTRLNIWNNQLEELPPEIKQLTNLNYLNISNNKLEKLPSGLIDNIKGEIICDNNPLLDPPLFIAEQGIEKIRQWQSQGKAGHDKNKKSFVWRSNQYSSYHKIISLWAVAETAILPMLFIAAMVYQIIDIRYFFLSLLISPLLLLSTADSAQKAAQKLAVLGEKLDVKSEEKIVGKMFLFGLSAFMIKIGIGIKEFLCHPIAAIENIPENWRRLSLTQDIWTPPQLLPDMEQNYRHHPKYLILPSHTLYNYTRNMFLRLFMPDKNWPVRISAMLGLSLFWLIAIIWRVAFKLSNILYWPIYMTLLSHRKKPKTGEEKFTQSPEHLLKSFIKIMGFSIPIPLIIYLNSKLSIDSYDQFVNGLLNIIADDPLIHTTIFLILISRLLYFMMFEFLDRESFHAKAVAGVEHFHRYAPLLFITAISVKLLYVYSPLLLQLQWHIAIGIVFLGLVLFIFFTVSLNSKN